MFGDKRSAYLVSLGKPEGKRRLGRLGRRRDDDIKCVCCK
jgi:hypothetical protein